MTIVKRMSHEEQRVQHETISKIDTKVSGIDNKTSVIDMRMSDIVKIGKIWMPILGALIAVASFIAGMSIKANNWNESLVKKPQFEKIITMLIRQDSMFKANIDTLNKNKISRSEIKQYLIVKNETKKSSKEIVVRAVTAKRNADGSYTYYPVPIN